MLADSHNVEHELASWTSRAPTQQVFVLAGVAGLNLLLCGFLIWLTERYWPAFHWLNQGLTGAALGFVALAGIWCGLGDGRWYIRVPAGVALCPILAWVFACAVKLSGPAASGNQPDDAAMIGFILMPIVLAVTLLALQLRRLRGWRLTWSANVISQPGRQYQLGDMLVWMVLIAGGLAAVRFLDQLDPEFREGLWELGILTMHVVLATILAAVTAFHPRGLRPKHLLALAAVVVLLGVLLSSYPMYSAIRNYLRNVPAPRLLGRNSIMKDCLLVAFRQLRDQQILSWSAVLLNFLNCLVLKRTGCRLVRPDL